MVGRKVYFHPEEMSQLQSDVIRRVEEDRALERAEGFEGRVDTLENETVSLDQELDWFTVKIQEVQDDKKSLYHLLNSFDSFALEAMIFGREDFALLYDDDSTDVRDEAIQLFQRFFRPLEILTKSEQPVYIQHLLDAILASIIHDLLSIPGVWEHESDFSGERDYKIVLSGKARSLAENHDPSIVYAMQLANKYPAIVDGDGVVSNYDSIEAATVAEGTYRFGSVLPPNKIELETSNLFGVAYRDMPIEVKKVMAGYGVDLMSEEYDKLFAVSRTMDMQTRIEFAQAFMAVEYGSDMGRLLILLAEKHARQDADHLMVVLGRLNKIRQKSSIIATRFDSEAFQKMFVDSCNKRVSELLALVYAGGLERIKETMMNLSIAMESIAVSLENDEFEIVEAHHDYGTLRAVKNPVTITVRPYGDNARLGFTVRKMGEDEKQRLSVRLDYEEGMLSLDIGSTAKEGVNSSQLSRRIGQDLADGERAIANIRGVEALHGNHVREAFESLGVLEPAAFSQIVNHFLYQLQIQEPIAPERSSKMSRPPKNW